MTDTAYLSALTTMSTRPISISRGTMSGAKWQRRLATEGLRNLSLSSNMGRKFGKVGVFETLGSRAND